MRILVATRNPGKLREFTSLLGKASVDICGLEQFPELPEVVEDGDSFSANACKKALECAKRSQCLTLADDSGLVVPALNGAPGICSARYAGEQADDTQNNQKLIAALASIPPQERQAFFQCVIALADAEGQCRTFVGRLDGQIITQPRGEHGFGYDPLFLVPEYGKTLAELSADIKNRISHRGKALEQLLPVLNGPDLFAG